jgi:hypothetical protein
MNHLKPILLILAFLTLSQAYANKDRIERPQSFKFTLENKEVVNLETSDSMLEQFCEDIVFQKIKITQAVLTYKTGEVLTARFDGRNWISINISYKGESASVPKMVLKKIGSIHFTTLNLLWPSGEKTAFDSDSFFIEFDTDPIKYFDKFPKVNISFKNHFYSECGIWKPTADGSMEWSNL